MVESSSHFFSPKILRSSTHRFLLLPVLAYSASSPAWECTAIRKNRLRPKLLKLSRQPLPSVPISVKEREPICRNSAPLIVAEDSILPDKTEDIIADEVLSTDEKVEPYASSVEYSRGVGMFTVKSALKFGVYFFGVLIFQTISAVLIFGVSHSVKEEQNLYLRQLRTDEVMPSIEEEEIERRVREIRELARKVREREKLEKEGLEMAEIRRESEIEEEIVARLSKVDERFDATSKDLQRRNSPFEHSIFSADDLKNDNIGGVEDAIFEKSNFRTTDTLLELSASTSAYGNDLEESLQETFVEGSQIQAEQTVEPSWPQNQQANNSSSLSSVDTTTGSDTQMISDTPVRKNMPADTWWLKLPYILVILMRQHSDEGAAFYAINNTSDTYTVAFEDHRDARNFCFLLESHFEDVENFSADIIPFSTKDLKVSDLETKMLVVKKGQLKLYAGQPLTDVEEALCTIL